MVSFNAGVNDIFVEEALCKWRNTYLVQKQVANLVMTIVSSPIQQSHNGALNISKVFCVNEIENPRLFGGIVAVFYVFGLLQLSGLNLIIIIRLRWIEYLMDILELVLKVI